MNAATSTVIVSRGVVAGIVVDFPLNLRHCEELATKLLGNFALKRRSNPVFFSIKSGLLRCRSQ